MNNAKTEKQLIKRLFY